MRRLLCVVALLTAACGGSTPVAPSPPPVAQIAGSWSGTFESLTYASEAVLVDLNQTGSTITGTWVMTSGLQARGNISGTVDPSAFSGSVTYNYLNGPTCVASFSGLAANATLNWTSPGFTTGTCGLSAPGNPLGVRFVLQRR